MCLADAKTSYLFNAYIYTGKGNDGIGLSEKEKNISVPTQSLIKLCKPIQVSNWNITADNWFFVCGWCRRTRKKKTNIRRNAPKGQEGHTNSVPSQY